MRPPSSLIRTLRALTALVTVWCLGCAALDPLISELAAQPGSALMDCASEGAVAAINVDEEPSVSAYAPDEKQSGAICDCQSCLAPAPTVVAAAPAAPPAPDDPARSFAAPTSIERAPLVPPPQPIA